MIIPVVAGIAVGIGLIVLFSISTKPIFSMSDDELRQSLMVLPEIQAFHEKMSPETTTPTEDFRREGKSVYVNYQIERTWGFGNDPTTVQDDLTKVLRLYVKVDPFGKTQMEIECNAGGVVISRSNPTPQEIRMTTCLESSYPPVTLTAPT